MPIQLGPDEAARLVKIEKDQNGMKGQLDMIAKQLTQMLATRSNFQQGAKERGKGLPAPDRTCFRCHSTAHWAKDCPTKQRDGYPLLPERPQQNQAGPPRRAEPKGPGRRSENEQGLDQGSGDQSKK